MAEKKSKTKSAILGELESIKDLLQDREGAQPNNECDEPPILTDEIKPSIKPLNLSESPQPSLSAPPKQTAFPPRRNNPLAAQGSLFPASAADSDAPPGEKGRIDCDPLAELNRLSSELNKLSGTINGPLTKPVEPLSNNQSIATHSEPQPKTGEAPLQERQSPPQPQKKSPAKHQVQKAQTPITMIENPFLPKHIRDRLHTGKSLIDEIKDSPSFAGVVKPSYAPGTLIDELIGEFMPKIEAELRRRLENLIQPSLIPSYQACDTTGEEEESPALTQPFSSKD